MCSLGVTNKVMLNRIALVINIYLPLKNMRLGIGI